MYKYALVRLLTRYRVKFGINQGIWNNIQYIDINMPRRRWHIANSHMFMQVTLMSRIFRPPCF